ncbi:MAG: 2-isopropylmalate synthase, partial [Candidatus Bathyarchaeia archaeon]
SLTPSEKLEIAKQLDKLGVDVIEAGFPRVSEGEKEAIKLIVNEKLNSEICGLARVDKNDLDAIIDCGLSYVHLFIATSDIHLKYKLKITREQALQKALEAIDYMKTHGLKIEFSAEDATRSDLNFLKSFLKSVADAGVYMIDIPDTVGIMTPKRMLHLIGELKTEIDKPLSVHCHNDFGMAVANSLSAIEAGATQAHVTVNGIGERAGNAALEELVSAIHFLYGKKTRIKLQYIYETSKLVSRLTGVIVQPNKAIVGDNAFTHESGIHTHGVISMPFTYEPIKPELVGRKRYFQPGKHSGTHGILKELEEVGIHPTKEQLDEIVSKVKELGDKGKMVTDADLIAIAESIIGKTVKEKKVVSLVDLAVMTGISVLPTASVKISLEGKEFIASEVGVGPVDAAMKAIQKLTDSLVNVKLKEYRLEAVTGGSDAIAEVLIKVEDKYGNIVSARAAHEDIVMASVEAMIEGINKILIKMKK